MIRSSLPALLWATMAFALILVGCSNQRNPSYPYPSTPIVSAQPVGAQAPDFPITLYQGEKALGGKELRFHELLAQGKPVVLNLWAGACPPCRLEMPDLQKVHEEYQDRVLMFGLDVGPFVGLGSREDGQALLKELNVTYPNGTTYDPTVVEAFRVVGMPTTFFILPDGQLVRQWTGLLTRKKMAELVEELLTAASSTYNR